jgi:hypothetical protein
MNKEPLRTKVIGQGNGKTARELGLDIVAHETNNFLAYESITRAHTGDPNVLISRNDASGEAAINGDGFYTRTGREGARGTGLTIRFHVDPNAREGTDFIRVSGLDHVIFRNKAALKVIPESLDIGPVEYFRMLASQDIGIDSSDRGILEKLRRRIGNKFQVLSKEQQDEIYQILKLEVSKFNKDLSPALREWFALPVSSQNPELVDALLKKGTADEAVVTHVLSQPHWKNHPEWVEALLKKGNVDYLIAQHVVSKAHWKEHPEWVEKLLKDGKPMPGRLTFVSSSRKSIFRHLNWAEVDNNLDYDIAMYVLREPHWSDHPEWVKKIIQNPTASDYYLTLDHWKNHPELRRLSGGAEPTRERLLFGMQREAQGKPISRSACFFHRLSQFLK